ncbi:type I-F CRISPR-associated protein Csy2 [Ferrimonas senticii]|uniref:type I-F CRISPR-associated protein Csy2 n=1 Tax=Ferrimonas senticii TaxID=394566 RepID=UPI0003FC966A|nr:type I-F CRISPR-associated protein Csy2 [Ferrimonas senticii]
MHLSELLKIPDIEERDKQLRRAFSPATALIEVSGSELKALTILCNLTFKRNDVQDLLSISQAKQVLSDPVHFERCLKEARWFHSHNLKYPDPRVSHQRLILPQPQTIFGAITSSAEPALWGWSHNSSEVNRARLFSTAFLMGGEATCLAEQVILSPSKWLPKLAQRALPSETRKQLRQRLLELLEQSTLPEEISSYSKQIRVFDGRDYCSVTPVVSHSLQSKIQQLANSRQLRAITIEHAHPASVSDLVASQGGRVRALFYPPPVYVPKSQGLAGALSNKIRHSGTAFDYKALSSRHFVFALEQLVGSQGFQTLRERRRMRAASLRVIRRSLAQWLSPILEWRDDLEERGLKLNLPAGLERDLLVMPKECLPESLLPLSSRLQAELEQSHYSKPYAYHPELLLPLKNQLKWLLNELAKEDEAISEESTSLSYLHLSGLRVFDAQALSNPYLVGIPSLSALWGLAHQYQRKLTELLGRPIQIAGTAWYIAQYNLNESKKLPEPRTPRKVSAPSEVKRPGILDNKLCDMSIELVFKLVSVDGEAPLSPEELNLAQAAFPSRFAGGCLQPPCLYEHTHWCQLHTSPQELFDELKRLPRGGAWVYPTATGVTALDELPELLTENPSYRPASIGFVALEEPQERAGSLERTHCYAEPAIGVVNCVGPIEVRLAGLKSFLEKAFWQMDVDGRAMLLHKATLLEPFYGVRPTS